MLQKENARGAASLVAKVRGTELFEEGPSDEEIKSARYDKRSS